MIIIPARLASTRFPNKILTDILGLPMVIRTAKAVEGLDEIVIATDSDEVIQIAQKHDIRAVLTSKSHQSGTDRINEAAQKLSLKEDEIVINMQADEPFIEKEVILTLKKKLEELREKDEWVMASCYKKISKSEALDPNIVKVVLDQNQNALYFSRCPIPYDRENTQSEYFGHLGLYGFTSASLRTFCTYPTAPIEQIEKLEQLRALYFGKTINMIEVKSKSFGIDTPEDLEKALKTFSAV
ncbi:MAG: 3-deoxy-manno-octulosonate cytidylyltransferase [Campylobacteraceae bacterium]|jgi:3-deoxy-manno-octulosonate cytidylyltransferase (CMP-KDO synthetase)|nr:3-deoxy-manno-octulosonate cytidylyltransferase [Campylobacteraceae bacterium]